MNVQFDEDNFSGPQNFGGMPQQPQSSSGSGMIGWMVRSGLAKDTNSANVILTILALIVFGISIYFFMFGFSKPTFSGPQQPPQEIPGVTL